MHGNELSSRFTNGRSAKNIVEWLYRRGEECKMIALKGEGNYLGASPI